MRKEECGMRSAGVRGSGVRRRINAEGRCRMQKSECGMRNEQQHATCNTQPATGDCQRTQYSALSTHHSRKR